MFAGKVSQQSLKTSEIPVSALELWPLNNPDWPNLVKLVEEADFLPTVKFKLKP